MGKFKLKVCLVLLVFFKTLGLYSAEYSFDDIEFKIDVPDNINFEYSILEKKSISDEDSDIKLQVLVQPLANYLSHKYASMYLSSDIKKLISSGDTVTSDSFYELLNSTDSSFVMIRKTPKYDISDTYKKVKSNSSVIGESYFGLDGEGGLAPRGYQYKTFLLFDDYFVSIILSETNPKFCDEIKSANLYQNEFGSWLVRDPISESLSDLYTEVNETENILAFNTMYNDIISSISFDNEGVVIP